MNKIQIISLTSKAEIDMIKKRINLAMRLTQHGHEINDLDDLEELFHETKFAKGFMELPHEVPQKAGVISIAIVGASRRFLAQITKHHEAFIVSSSLQYSNYKNVANFCVPYEIINTDKEQAFLESCYEASKSYDKFVTECSNDTSGYLMPQALRSIIMITATIPVWQHIIRQRICKRNTDETRYIALRILDIFQRMCPELFPPIRVYPCCEEGKLACGNGYRTIDANEILSKEFSKLW